MLCFDNGLLDTKVVKKDKLILKYSSPEVFLRALRFKKCLGLLWASPVAQLVRNSPAILETCVPPLEKGKATHSSIMAWRIPQTV